MHISYTLHFQVLWKLLFFISCSVIMFLSSAAIYGGRCFAYLYRKCAFGCVFGSRVIDSRGVDSFLAHGFEHFMSSAWNERLYLYSVPPLLCITILSPFRHSIPFLCYFLSLHPPPFDREPGRIIPEKLFDFQTYTRVNIFGAFWTCWYERFCASSYRAPRLLDVV